MTTAFTKHNRLEVKCIILHSCNLMSLLVLVSHNICLQIMSVNRMQKTDKLNVLSASMLSAVQQKSPVFLVHNGNLLQQLVWLVRYKVKLVQVIVLMLVSTIVTKLSCISTHTTFTLMSNLSDFCRNLPRNLLRKQFLFSPASWKTILHLLFVLLYLFVLQT